jgi:hypothetical protein
MSLRHLSSGLQSVHAGNQRDYLLGTIVNAQKFFQPNRTPYSQAQNKTSFAEAVKHIAQAG